MKIKVKAIVDSKVVEETFDLGEQANKFDAWNAFDRMPKYWGKIINRIQATIL